MVMNINHRFFRISSIGTFSLLKIKTNSLGTIMLISTILYWSLVEFQEVVGHLDAAGQLERSTLEAGEGGVCAI
jgi:hypothetical protein